MMKTELQRGIEHEMEHGKHFPKNKARGMAWRIAEDHLREDPRYYSKLERCMPKRNSSNVIRGEWWIDHNGRSSFADGDMSDMNHEMIAFYDALGVDPDDSSIPEMIAGDSLSKEAIKYLKREGVEKSTIEYFRHGGDARKFQIKKNHWIRVAGDNFELWTFDDDALSRIQNFDGWEDADCDGEIEECETQVLIEEASTKNTYSPTIKVLLAAQSAQAVKRMGDPRDVRYWHRNPSGIRITKTNLYALKDWAAQGFPERVPPTDHPHIKRCLKAGLAERGGDGKLGLTPLGQKALADFAARGQRGAMPEENPAELNRQAIQVFHMWHAKPPTGWVKDRVELPDDLVCAGEAVQIDYASTKWLKPKAPAKHYYHLFDSHPGVYVSASAWKVAGGEPVTPRAVLGEFAKRIVGAYLGEALELEFRRPGAKRKTRKLLPRGTVMAATSSRKYPTIIILIPPGQPAVIITGGRMEITERGIIR